MFSWGITGEGVIEPKCINSALKSTTPALLFQAHLSLSCLLRSVALRSQNTPTSLHHRYHLGESCDFAPCKMRLRLQTCFFMTPKISTINSPQTSDVNAKRTHSLSSTTAPHHKLISQIPECSLAATGWLIPSHHSSQGH